MQESVVMEMTTDEAMRDQYLTFRVYDSDFGIEICYVKDITKIQDIAPVPHTSRYVKGIINLRGTIVPIIDMRIRFGHDEIAYTDRTCIIVLSMDDIDIGIIVDEVLEVLTIPDESIHTPPRAIDNSSKSHFVKGIGRTDGAVKQILDIYKVFEVAE